MKITIEGNTVDGSARSTLNIVLSGARGPAGEPSPLGVPYTGATQDVNLGEFGLLTGNVEFDTTPTNAPTGAGSMSWNDTDGTVNLVLKGGNVISKLGETQHIRAYNNTGTAIARGKVVYVSGAQGQRLTVALADADTEILSKDTIGFTAESIADGAEGFVIIAGVLLNMNTSGMADGATVYLSQTAGGYTTTPPVDPAHLVILGFIVNGGSGGAGSIYVKVDNGYELEELHGVADAAKVTPVGADALLLRDSADNNLWKRLTWTNALAGMKTHMDTFKGVAGGYASLDGSGKIPSTELPSYVDDVVESASFASLPVTGETGKIYVTLDTNKCYRWSGSVYVEVSQGIDTLTTTGTSGAATLVGSTLNIPQYQSVLTNPVTGTGTAGQVAYFNGTSAVTGSANLFWDAANGRLGIGTTSPTEKLHVASGNATINGNIYFGNASHYLATDNSTYAMLSSNRNLQLARSGTPALTIDSSLNVVIGTTSPSARLHVRGSGTTSATTAMLVQNNDVSPARLMSIRDDGRVYIGSQSDTQAPFLAGYTGTSPHGASQRALGIVWNGGAGTRPNPGVLFTASSDTNWTSGSGDMFQTLITFNPTSGTGVLNSFVIQNTINQTGGANGITRGLYVSPILTAAADWRSVEFSNNTGWGIYGAGTANNYLAGSLGIGTTSLSNSGLAIQRNITGTTSVISVNNTSVVQSDVTSVARYFATNATTQAATFNLGLLIHYSAGQSTFGLNSTVTNQYGYFVSSGLTGATNNFAFRGELASAANNWNLYMSGTAANYLAGNTSIGTTTESARLLVRGSGTTSATTALLVQNSTPTELLSVRDDGRILLGVGGQIISNVAGGVADFSTSVGSGAFRVRGVGRENNNQTFEIQNARSFTTSSTSNVIETTPIILPTSGSTNYTIFSFLPTINQTGGANGITRGLYVNPTLTSAADWRGIESVAASNANHTLLKLRNATVDVFTVKSDSKIGFFNATPVSQPTTGIAEATFVENSGGTAVNVDSTFAGYTIQQIAQALKNIGILA